MEPKHEPQLHSACTDRGQSVNNVDLRADLDQPVNKIDCAAETPAYHPHSSIPQDGVSSPNSSVAPNAAADETCSAVPEETVHRRRANQKRYREKKKEHSLKTESLISEIQTRLNLTETQRCAFESKCKVLEDLIFKQGGSTRGPLQSIQDAPSSSVQSVNQEFQADATALHIPDAVRAILLPAVKLMPWTSTPYYLTPQDITHLSDAEFAKLFTAAISEMRSILQACPDIRSMSAEICNLLQPSVQQAIALKMSIMLCNPCHFQKLNSLSMEDGTSPLPRLCYDPHTALASMALCESQVQDLLMLRRLFFSKLGSLTRERRALVMKMSQHSQQLTDMRQWAEQVQQNVEQERQVMRHMLTATRFGVHTVSQNAFRMVAVYPAVLDAAVYETLAKCRGEPSGSDIMSQQADYSNGMDWADVVTYVSSITAPDMSRHVPFVSNFKRE